MRRVSTCTCALLLVVASFAARAEAQTPKGMVEEPRLQSFDIPADKLNSITFKGWVDFPQSAGTVRMIVQTDATQDSADPFLWTEVAQIRSATTPISGTTNRYRWQATLTTSTIFGFNRWPRGGIARVRFRAVRNGAGFAYLPVRDKDGVAGKLVDLVLSDSTPSPVDGGLDNTPRYLNKQPNDLLVNDETGKYYLSVGTDEYGGGLKILSALFTLGDFKDRYFTFASSCAGSTPEYVTKYFNKGDLGLGREMHCIWNGCTQETACYVKNYGGPGRNGNVFDNRTEAKKALDAHEPFATVAMVERYQMPVGAPNKVFFVVYDHNAQWDPADENTATIAYEAKLDNKGYNKSIPTNCLVCHGTNAKYVKNTAFTFPYNSQVKGVQFLPFDLTAFEYFSSDSANSLSRAKQEGKFKEMNNLVYFTDLWFNSDAREVINGWYGSGTRTTFDNNFVPFGWKNTGSTAEDANRKQLYLKVVAKSCRTCHISHFDTDSAGDPYPWAGGNLTFGTFDAFKAQQLFVWADVCVNQSMPNAEQALKVFWSGHGRSQLLNRFPETRGCNNAFAPANSARMSASAASSPTSAASVAKDYAAATCACSTPDCFRQVDERFASPLTSAPLDSRSSNAVMAEMSAASTCRERVAAKAARPAAGRSLADRIAERDQERKARFLSAH